MKEEEKVQRQKEFIELVSAMEEHKFCDYHAVVYVNNVTPVRIWCNKHQKYFSQSPKAHKLGQSCPDCGKEKLRNQRRWQRFIDESRRRFGDVFEYPNIETEYKNSHSKITFRCKKCGAVFTKTACDHITSDKGGCTNCTKLKLEEKNSYTYERLKSILAGEVDQMLPYEGVKYHDTRDSKTCVDCVCPIHGEYRVSLRYLVSTGNIECSRCAKSRAGKGRGLVPNIRERIEAIFPNELEYEVSEFVNTSTNMTFTCRRCGHTFQRTPNSILQRNSKHACPQCWLKQTSMLKTKTTEQFIEDVKKVHGEDAFDFEETVYIQSNQYVTLRCRKCGRTFQKEANSVLQGNGCPYHNLTTSGCEKNIVSFIRSLNIGEVLDCDRTVIKPLELDIFLPEQKIAFEFDGIFWHCETNKPDDYHINKTLMCEKQGVRLIHIFEDEWKTKQPICESMIRNILSVTPNKVYARKCEVREVSPHDAGVFLDSCHIQGKCGSTYRYGLYYNGELVSLMTFGKSRHFIGNGKTEYELLRFCNKLNTSVVGGASKLLKHFIRLHNPNEIVSYADRRWSVGRMYETLGFELYNKSKPNYHYVVGEQRKNRFNFRKSVLVKKYGCPPDMSEREFCKQQHWYRIYDCGCLCYKWKKK